MSTPRHQIDCIGAGQTAKQIHIASISKAAIALARIEAGDELRPSVMLELHGGTQTGIERGGLLIAMLDPDAASMLARQLLSAVSEMEH